MGHDNKFLNLLYFCVSWPIKEKIKKKGSCVLGRVAAFTPVTKWRYAQHTTYKDFLATHFLDHNTHKKKRDKELICDPRKWWPKSLSFPLSCPTSNQRLLAQSLAGGQDKGKGKGEPNAARVNVVHRPHLSGAYALTLSLTPANLISFSVPLRLAGVRKCAQSAISSSLFFFPKSGPFIECR